MPKQDTSRPDRKRKPKKIVCRESGKVFDDVHALADAVGTSAAYCYQIINSGRDFNGFHYDYITEGGEPDADKRSIRRTVQGGLL